MRHFGAVLLLSILGISLGGCGNPDTDTSSEEDLPIYTASQVYEPKMPQYSPAPIPIVSSDENEKDRLQKKIDRLVTTLHDDVKWEIIEFGPRAIDMLINGLKRGDDTALRKDTTRAFIQHDMGDACDSLLREMVVFHSNYAGEELPRRGDFAGWMTWWGKHKNDMFFYSPAKAEQDGTSLAQH